jgi:hypothetical protein
MIELVKYFRILFLSTKISRERLKGFTEDHIQRLTANNPGGIFTLILTNVTNAYTAYYGDLSSESVIDSVKQGKTVAMNDSRTALEKNISGDEKLIAFTYLNNPSLYQEFFPGGLTEYHNADLPTFGTIADRFKAALAAHSADFPPAFVSAYGTLHTTFTANRTAQLAAFGTLSGERSDVVASKLKLAKQLTTNLLTIALQFVGDESKADVYFNQALLDAAFREADKRVSNDINPGETANVFDNVISPDIRISIKNESEQALVAGFVTAADVIPALITIASGNEIILNASELGWTSEKHFFNISNGSGVAGRYTVEKL